MSTPARRRLMRDFKRLQEDPPAGVSGAPSENNIMVWNAVIFGPEGTPFEDGTFKLIVEFTEEYPNKPPTVRFVSKMFHPNVYADGSICLDILQNRWSPTYDVSSILTSIQSLLDEPNPNSPANSQAAQLYQENKREYEKRVSAIVEQSWRDSWPDKPESCSLHCEAVCAASFSGVPLFFGLPTFLISSFYALYLPLPFIECFPCPLRRVCFFFSILSHFSSLSGEMCWILPWMFCQDRLEGH